MNKRLPRISAFDVALIGNRSQMAIRDVELPSTRTLDEPILSLHSCRLCIGAGMLNHGGGVRPLVSRPYVSPATISFDSMRIKCNQITAGGVFHVPRVCTPYQDGPTM